MKKSFTILCGIIFLITGKGFSQQNFTVHLLPSAITSVPPVHSGAVANRNGKWIFLGGRIDGMHIMQANQAFPDYSRNDSVFVVDPLNNTYSSASTQQLPLLLHGAICSSNMQYYQDGRFLYMIGGYGFEDSTQTYLTFPTLTSVDLDSLMIAVSNSSTIINSFRMIVDSNFAVTGGEMDRLDSTYYLVFGHRFDGRYAKGPSVLFTQRYTHDIRKFSIHDDGVNLSISNYIVLKDTDVFHRRDFNLVPQIYPNHQRGFTAFGGVFRKQQDLPFLTPIDITESGVQHQTGFNENLNQYTTATMPVYDSLNNAMHTVFFGGISLYTLDTANMTLHQDTLVPFVSTISRITRDSNGNLNESKLPENMPALKGTNAVFIGDQGAPWIDGKFIDLNALSGNTRVGYIMGGIHSDFPNVADIDPTGMSRPNAQVYDVYIDKSANGINDLPLKNEVNNLLIYPNPAADKLEVEFSVTGEKLCEIKLFDTHGKFLKTLLPEKKLSGNQHLHFLLNVLKDGVYVCYVKVAESVKAVTVIVER